MSRLEVLDARSRDTLNGSTAIAGARSMATRGRGWCHRLQRPGHSGNRTASARRCRASQRRYSKWTNSRRSPTVATSTGEILARKGLALQSPRPSHDAERNAEGRSANRTLPPCPDKEPIPPAAAYHYVLRARDDAAPLLAGSSVLRFRDQGTRYFVKGAPHHALKARACGRTGPDVARSQSRRHEDMTRGVEHPFGTVKDCMGATQFLTKGLEGRR